MATYPWYRRHLEVAPALAALGASAQSLPAPVTGSTSAGPGAAASMAIAAGAPSTAAANNAQRVSVAATPTTGGERLPAWARQIGLPPSALSRLPGVFQASQVYQPANLPGGATLNLAGGTQLDPRVRAILGSPGTGTGLGDIGDIDWGDIITTTFKTGAQIGTTLLTGNKPAPAAAPPPPPPPVSVTASLMPQTSTQKYLLYGALGLGGILLLMQLRSSGSAA